MSVLLAFDKDTAISELLGAEVASPEVMAVPDFVAIQLDSFRWFQEEGLRELFNEISPIHGYSLPGLNCVFQIITSGNLNIPF
jgi:DNA-directed RNA polymerase subunit beta